jgi:hypothetical protein
VLLNVGDGTFAPMQTYNAGPACAGLAVDITFGDVTSPAPGTPDPGRPPRRLRVACAPYVVRLTGDGTGALTSPEAIYLGLPYLGSGTLDLLALMRRPDGNPAPCSCSKMGWTASDRSYASVTSSTPISSCATPRPYRGRSPSETSTGLTRACRPDEVVVSKGGALMGVFGFMNPPLT